MGTRLALAVSSLSLFVAPVSHAAAPAGPPAPAALEDSAVTIAGGSSQAAPRIEGLGVNVGAGFGAHYGLAGALVEVDLRHRSGLGISLDGGLGILASVGAHVWSPGQRVRVGLGANVGASYQSFESSCMGPDSPTRTTRFGMGGLDIAVDHDIGRQRGKLGMRYGLGAAVVGGGCVGFLLPAPQLAFYHRF